MTWWLDTRDGKVHLMDDDRLVANFVQQSDADEVLGMHDLIQGQGDLLTGVVNAIRGAPPDDTLWSHHDAPQLAAELVQHANKLGMFASLMRGMLPVCTDTARILIEDLERWQTERRTPLKDRK